MQAEKESRGHMKDVQSYLVTAKNRISEFYIELGVPRELFHGVRFRTLKEIDSRGYGHQIGEDLRIGGRYHIGSRTVSIRRQVIERIFYSTYLRQEQHPNAEEYLESSKSAANGIIAHEIAHHIKHNTLRLLPYEFDAVTKLKFLVVSDEGLATFASKVIAINPGYGNNRLLQGMEKRDSAYYREIFGKRNVELDRYILDPNSRKLNGISTILGYMIGNAAAAEARSYNIMEQNRMLGRILREYDDSTVMAELLGLAERSGAIDGKSTRYFNSFMEGTGLILGHKDIAETAREDLPLFLRR